MNEKIFNSPRTQQTLDSFWKALIVEIRAAWGEKGGSKPVRKPRRPICIISDPTLSSSRQIITPKCTGFTARRMFKQTYEIWLRTNL
jgi:hypothetical protein